MGGLSTDVAPRPNGRVLALDGLGAALAGAVMVFGSQQAAGAAGRRLDQVAYALMAIAVAALLGRRVWPRTTLAVTVALAAVYLAAGYPRGPFFLAPAIAMYGLAVRSPVRPSLAACGLAVAVLLAGHLPELLGPERGRLLAAVPEWAAWAAGWLGLPWAVGTVVRLGREETMRTREEEVRRRAYEERLRVAREVHDVVGHGLAVINMQAGVALHVLDKRPEQVKVALEAIKTTSKDALEEVRGTLAVFRQPDEDGAPRRPTPGLDQLETLVAEMTQSGLPVDLTVTGERASLPGGVELAAYRIVQESLTNVLRHAGPANAKVSVSYQPGAVDLEITDDGRASQAAASRPGGHGIVGMRERAATVGGTLEAGPRAGGGFRVHARLPTGEGA